MNSKIDPIHKQPLQKNNTDWSRQNTLTVGAFTARAAATIAFPIGCIVFDSTPAASFRISTSDHSQSNRSLHKNILDYYMIKWSINIVIIHITKPPNWLTSIIYKILRKSPIYSYIWQLTINKGNMSLHYTCRMQ